MTSSRIGTFVALLVLASTVAGVASAGVAGPNDAAVAPSTEHASVAALESCSFPYSSVDATGTEVTLQEAPERVVSLNPSAAQTMWEIGARDKVVGVSQFAGFLADASSRTTVTSGRPATVNVEAVVGLEPDLVLAPNVITNDTVDKLRQAGVTVYRFDAATTIDDVADKTRLIGRLTGACGGANATVTDMQSRLDVVSAAVDGQERPDVYVPLGGGFTAGSGTFVHEAVTTAGGHNVATDANITFYGEMSNEVLLREDPEYVVLQYSGEKPDDPRTLLPKNDALNQTTAVQEGNLVLVAANNVSQPAPRVVSAVETMTKALHADAYAEAQTSAEAATDENATTTTAGSTDGGDGSDGSDDASGDDTGGTTTTATTADSSTTSSSDGQAGFGVGVAVLALLGSLVLVRRR